MNFKTKKDKKIYIIILSIGLLIFSSGYLYLKMNLLKNEFEF